MATEKVAVSDAEIQQVEQAVRNHENAEVAKIEERVRKELTAEARARELETQLETQKALAESAKADAERAKAEAEAMIKAQVEARLRAEQARTKAPVSGGSPFAATASGSSDNIVERMRQDPSLLEASEKASMAALMTRSKRI